MTGQALTRLQAATLAVAAKRAAGITWAQVAQALDRSLVWSTSAVLGQQTLTAEQAATVCRLLDLPGEVELAMQLPPDRTAAVDLSDPLVYRLTEMVQVYGATIRELVGEEFGDGIVSAIDFELDVERVADPKGDRAVLTLNGKFLPYRVW
ncbi:MAG: cyanase [Actinomycetota bacterium]|jgi:cyanate lyase|nr:cyanase [Actinomycetota bacterium]